MTTILIVDDDHHIVTIVSEYLIQAGYKTMTAKDGMEALQQLKRTSCQLVIVDVMMPYMNGYELTKEIRQKYDIPIILLTAKGQISDKEIGFKSGTDDYLVKPFEPKELLFRIEALLRRYNQSEDKSIIKIGNTIINKASYEVQVNEKTLLLPLKEFDLLYHLMSHPMQAFSREQLITYIWGLDFAGDDRTVDVHIKRLRERFANVSKDFSIKTIRGVGYMLEVRKS